jgi:hypothetical protein
MGFLSGPGCLNHNQSTREALPLSYQALLKVQNIPDSILAGQFTHPEAKALNGNAIGIMQRRYVRVRPDYYVIGRESNRIKLDEAQATEGIIGGEPLPELGELGDAAGGFPDEYAHMERGTDRQIYPKTERDEMGEIPDEVMTLLQTRSIAYIMGLSGLNKHAIMDAKHNRICSDMTKKKLFIAYALSDSGD